MKQIVFLSGKGGTGKTTFSSSLAAILDGAIAADCDVDGSNMPIVLGGEVIKEGQFYGMPRVSIDPAVCTMCGLCERLCQFDAIHPPHVGLSKCEGCMVCLDHCPQSAIKKFEIPCGKWFISRTAMGHMVHARLNPGEENSGKLVNKVRTEAKALCPEDGVIVLDGPPGIGCPAISSLTGSDLAVIVAEPSISSLHDAERLLDLIRKMKVKPAGIINKHDLSDGMSSRIEGFFLENGVQMCGRLCFSAEIPMIQRSGTAPVLSASEQTRRQLRSICSEVVRQAGITEGLQALGGV